MAGDKIIANAAAKWAPTLKTAGSHIGEAFGKLFGTAKGSAGFVGSVAKRPVKWAIDGARMPIQAVSYAFGHHPRLAAGATVLGGAAIIGNALHGNAAKHSNEALVAQAQQQSYMNSVSPQEAAYMMAMQKSGTGPAGGFAAAQAERAAQAAAPAGPAA